MESASTRNTPAPVTTIERGRLQSSGYSAGGKSSWIPRSGTHCLPTESRDQPSRLLGRYFDLREKWLPATTGRANLRPNRRPRFSGRAIEGEPSVVYPPSAPAAARDEGCSQLKQVEAAIELAHRWAEGLRKGRWKTLRDVAQAQGVSIARISQLLSLSLFSVPDSMAAAQSMKRPSLRKLIAWARRQAT